jgi:hypothetical protein
MGDEEWGLEKKNGWGDARPWVLLGLPPWLPYNIGMKSSSLSKSNRYLADKAKARKLVIRSIASSTAIETREPVSRIEAKLNRQRSPMSRVKLA